MLRDTKGITPKPNPSWRQLSISLLRHLPAPQTQTVAIYNIYVVVQSFMLDTLTLARPDSSQAHMFILATTQTSSDADASIATERHVTPHQLDLYLGSFSNRR